MTKVTLSLALIYPQLKKVQKPCFSGIKPVMRYCRKSNILELLAQISLLCPWVLIVLRYLLMSVGICTYPMFDPDTLFALLRTIWSKPNQTNLSIHYISWNYPISKKSIFWRMNLTYSKFHQHFKGNFLPTSFTKKITNNCKNRKAAHNAFIQ